MRTAMQAVTLRLRQTLIFGALVLLQSCGGGGSDAGTPPFGGGDGGGAKASDISVSLSSYSLQNSGTEAVTATVTALDANRNVVANAPVSIAVDANGIVAPSGTQTDASGVVTGVVSLGADRSNRVITVTVSSGSIQKTASFQVSGTKIVASLSGSVYVGTANQIRYRISDVNNAALVGAEVTVSAPGLTSATGTTNTNGEFLFDYTAPPTTGFLAITATAAGVSDSQVVQVVSSNGTVPPAVGPVTSASVTSNPDVVPVNVAGGGTNQAEIRALFFGANNAPISNVRVRYDLNGDPNSVGGTIASGDTLLYSNSNGLVTGAYRPGTRSSPTQGVSIRACWDYNDFTVGSCPNQVVTSLTVTSEPLAVTIGTNNAIIIKTLTYIKQFVVLVVDSSGQPKSGVTVTPTLDLPAYYKGFWTISGTSWVQTVRAACANEDIDRNGVMDNGEDINGNGSLDPRKSDVSVTMVDSNVTDASGLAVLQIEYPQNVASWDQFQITVSANGISGTEGRQVYTGILPVPASVVNDINASPAFVVSPYGTSGSCSNPN